jgi:hypothetical protein
MEPQAVYPLSNEITKAITDGFTITFVFIEGFLHAITDPEKVYAIKDVQKDPRPCLTSNTIVYRLITPDGSKGYAVTDWEEDP